MYNSLTRLQQLDDDTLIYCAHEYTLANLRFAQTVEPNNEAIAKRISQVESLRAANKPSLPSNLAIERLTNPFLRCNQTDVVTTIQQYQAGCGKEPLAIFTAMRAWKDHF